MEGILLKALYYFGFLLTLILAISYIYVKSLYKYFEKKKIVYDVPTFPLGSLKSAFLMRKSYTQVLADIYFKYKEHKVVGFFNFWKKQILITDPELIKNILVKEFDTFTDRGVYYNKKKDPLSAHLFALDGNEWRTLRTKLSPTFTSGKMKTMFPSIVACAKEMIDCADRSIILNKAVEGIRLFSRYGLSIISNIAFGLESDALSNEQSTFVRMAIKMTEPTFERLFAMMMMFNDNLAKMIDFKITPSDASKFFLEMVHDTIKYRQTSGVIRNDYMQLLLQLRESGLKDSEGGDWDFTEDELAAQAFVFIIAGSETTSSTLGFCFYELALNQSIQEKLFNEINTVTDCSYENITTLPYLDMVVEETLRKYPPLGFLNRVCNRDYLVPGTDIVIEKGTKIFISTHGLQNDPDLFPEPAEFKPERFSKENRDNIKPYTFMPFGEGPRYCIGMRFARVTVKTALVMLLKKYQVRLSPEVPVPAKIEPRTIISLPAGGMWLRFEPRFKIK